MTRAVRAASDLATPFRARQRVRSGPRAPIAERVVHGQTSAVRAACVRGRARRALHATERAGPVLAGVDALGGGAWEKRAPHVASRPHPDPHPNASPAPAPAPEYVALDLVRVVHNAEIRDAKLRDQAMRAAKSAALNIAEAAGRTSPADRARVFAIARGEAMEAAAAVEIAALTGDAVADAFDACLPVADRLVALLTGLCR